MTQELTGRSLRANKPPPFLSWRLTRYVVLLLCLIGIQIAFTSVPAVARLMARAGINPNWRFAIFGLYGVGLTALILWFQRADRTTRRRLVAGELPCWQCGYDLRATDSPGLCPECGKAFTVEALGEKWAKYLASTERPVKGKR